MGRLSGKVCIITGAAKGQGAVEARLFAEEGATVILTDVMAEEGAALAKTLDQRFIEHDVGDATQWSEVVSQTIDQHGKIDVLVNNAGIFKSARMLETELPDYERIIRVNQTGVFLGMQSAGAVMCEAGSGSIVNISSFAGMVGAPGAFAYATSKWAVRGMSKIAAQELGRFGVRVNSVHPGYIETDMLQQTPAATSGKMDTLVRRSVPLGRVASSEEVARVVLFLASDESSYVTNAELTVDGGLHK